MSQARNPRLSPWTVGVARRQITPGKNVELAGLGYYLGRTAQRVRDGLAATALVVGDASGCCVAFVALDLMYGDAAFTEHIRNRVAAQTNLRPEAICVNCSHSHNAPTASRVLGVGEVDEAYVQFVATTAAGALLEAWRERRPAHLRVGHAQVGEVMFNRTRENGPTDTRLSLFRADTLDGRPLAVAVNFHGHLNAHLEVDLHAVSRDWAGEVIDQIEARLPGVTALYWQGNCGDVMVRPELASSARRFEVAREISRAAGVAWESARALNGDSVLARVQTVRLPTRRWSREEVLWVRQEGLHRLQTGDTAGWLEGFARVCVNYPARLPSRYGGSTQKAVAAIARFAVEWSEAVLPLLESTPESLTTEVQGLRIGDSWFVAHSAELFTTFGLDVRRRWPHPDLFMLGYANGAIGYRPDACDIERQSYAAIQSPKFTRQFPFTPPAGDTLVAALLAVLQQVD